MKIYMTAADPETIRLRKAKARCFQEIARRLRTATFEDMNETFKEFERWFIDKEVERILTPPSR